MRNYSQELRRIAQNDYMIDTNFLPDGKLLNEIANRLQFLEDECNKLKKKDKHTFTDGPYRCFCWP